LELRIGTGLYSALFILDRFGFFGRLPFFGELSFNRYDGWVPSSWADVKGSGPSF
jgi:hypothetical protein